MAKTVEAYVNFVGDGRNGGKGGFLQNVDGWVTFDDSVNMDGVEKGAKVKALIAEKGNGHVCTKLKVLQPAGERKKSWGGRRGGGGGGYKSDPAVQRSIVMQHSQTVAVGALTAMLEQEVIKITGKTADAKVTAYLARLDEITAHLYAQAAEEGPAEFIKGKTETEEPEEDFDDDTGDESSDDGGDWDDD